MLGVSSSAVDYLSHYLVAVAETDALRLTDYHMVLRSGIRYKIRFAVNILYTSCERLASESYNVNYFSLRLSGTRCYRRNKHPVIRHSTEHTLSRNKIFYPVISLGKSERPAETCDRSRKYIKLRTQSDLHALFDGDKSFLTQFRKSIHKIFSAVFLGPAFGFKLIYRYCLFGKRIQKCDYLLFV